MKRTDLNTAPPAPTDTAPPAPTDIACRRVGEVLPWLLNGSLGEEERGEAVDHLAGCESCRDELEETTAAWDLLTEHIPSLALAQYAQGLAVEALSRERIEKHLAHCPSCRRELEWAAAGESEVGEPELTATGRKTAHLSPFGGTSEIPTFRPALRSWAIAAGIAGLVATGGLSWYLLELASPAPVAEVSADFRPVAGDATDERLPETDLFRNGFESGSVVSWSSSLQ